VESYREVVANGVLLTTSHDGYLRRRGASPAAMVAHDGSRLDGEDTVSPAGAPESRPGNYAAVSSAPVGEGEPAQRRGVMLVLPNRDVASRPRRRSSWKTACSWPEMTAAPHRPDRDPAGCAARSLGPLELRALDDVPPGDSGQTQSAASRNCRYRKIRQAR
jgi:hypothetical protein